MTVTPPDDPLTPYVPRLVVDWLAEEPARRHRTVSGTLVFADISGFTRLTERLATRGKAGAEEMGDLLNGVFEQLLAPAYDHGAHLLKWGGDAVLLLFAGDDHARHAARAAAVMQETIRAVGRLRTSAGPVRLGMSIGMHTGEVDFLLVGTRHRELVVTGPGATAVARTEKAAEPGQVLLSAAAARSLPPECTGPGVEDHALLRRAPEVEARPGHRPPRPGVDLGDAMCADLRDYLRGPVEQEHRATAVGFIAFGGVDDLLASSGPEVVTEAVADLVALTEEACVANGVTFLASDLDEDGGKLVLTAGVPLSVGDSETRMLATLRRVVPTEGPLTLRGGVTSGRVFAGDYGTPFRKTYSIAGDVVNLAARLMAAAAPGQVLATPTVVERSRTVFATAELPPFAVKGKAEPVRAYDVREPLAASVRGRRRLPLVGREAELAVLLDAAAEALAGTGQVVEVTAPPGAGKTRLVEELCDLAEARTLWVDGDIYGRATPYHPMQRLLRQALGLADDAAAPALRDRLVEVVTRATPGLVDWLPLIGVVAGVGLPETAAVSALDPEARRARLESATSELLGSLLDGPTVLVLNDTQFMDEASLGLARRVALDSVARRWLVVVTRRSDAAWPLGAMRHRTVELPPLAPDAAAALLAEATAAAPLPSYRVDQLVRRADGNPLFLTQLVAAAGSGADLDDLPDSVEGTIAAQIDRLPADRRRWLRAASVLGMSFDRQWLDELLAGTSLAGLGTDGLEELIALSPEGDLQFTHHLVRLTAYEGLPFRRRRELHRRASEVVEASAEHRPDLVSVLALHCLHGGRHDAAWRHAREAGRRAHEQHAVAEAAESYRLALRAAEALPDLDPGQRAEVCEALADAAMDLGESDEVERMLRRARAVARATPLSYARLCQKTAGHRQNVGRHGDAMRWVHRGRAALDGRIDPDSLRELSVLASRAARVRQDQAAYRSAFGWVGRAVDEARRARADDVLAEARAIQLVLRAQAGERWDAAEAAETLDLVDRCGTQRMKAWTANAIGMSAYFGGEWTAARSYYAEAEAANRRIGHDLGAAVCAANRAEILVQQHRSREAREVLEPTVRALVGAKATSFVSFALGLLARAEMLDGEHAAALEHFEEAWTLAVEMGETDEAAGIRAATVECLVACGDGRRALATAEATLAEVAGTMAALAARPALERAQGLALLAVGRRDEGLRALRDALAAARERDSAFETQACLAVLLRAGAAVSAGEAEAWAAERRRLAEDLDVLDEPSPRNA